MFEDRFEFIPKKRPDTTEILTIIHSSAKEMGATASVSPQLLPSELTDDDVHKLVGKEFDNLKGVLNAFKNERGKIETTEFLRHFESVQEREVYHLYEYYCTKDGRLSRSQFLRLCREAKLLHRAVLSSSTASSLFTTVCIDGDTVNYYIFRKQLLQEIANAIGTSLDDIVAKLAQVEVAIDFDKPGTNACESEDESDRITPIHSVSNVGSAVEGTEPLLKACVRLQSFQRRVTASRQVSELQEVMCIYYTSSFKLDLCSLLSHLV